MTGNASADIDTKIMGLADWRGAALARIRRLIKEADPDVVEEVKWRKPSNPAGVPTWSHAGISAPAKRKDKVKLTFMLGASLEDPADLFNASLDAGTRRAIDIREGDEVDSEAFKALVGEAVTANLTRKG